MIYSYHFCVGCGKWWLNVIVSLTGKGHGLGRHCARHGLLRSQSPWNVLLGDGAQLEGSPRLPLKVLSLAAPVPSPASMKPLWSSQLSSLHPSAFESASQAVSCSNSLPPVQCVCWVFCISHEKATAVVPCDLKSCRIWNSDRKFDAGMHYLFAC